MGADNTLSIEILGGLIKFRWRTGKGEALSTLVLLWIINMTIGIHSCNGEHIVAGVGIGPLEISITFHKWNRWMV